MSSKMFQKLIQLRHSTTKVRIFHESVRLCSSKQSSKEPSSAGASKYSREQVSKNVRGYVFTRYIDYVKNYDKVLEKNFPSAVHVYRLFFDGLKVFYSDMKRYLKITRIANTSANGLGALTRSELELYYQMPKDMFKVAPALLFSAVPAVGNMVFPLAYMYPRRFLTSHFWSLQQRADFQQLYLKERLICNRNVLRCLQAKLDHIRGDPLHRKWEYILGLLGSGLHPTIEEILAVKELFTKAPYQFSSLSQKHVKYLCYMHGLRGGVMKRIRLLDRCDLLRHMDIAITREGGVHNMLPDALRHACYLRGLNPVNMKNEDLIDWLRCWVKVSLALSEQHVSSYLHLPILIGYNHPNNWQLIYKS